MLITFEGIDGSGKSTQLSNLKDYLYNKKINVVTTREPGWESPLSGIMRHLVLEGDTSPAQKLFLLLADRADHYNKMICPILKGGYGVPSNVIILCDRGPDSTVAYQGFGEGLAPVDWIASANMSATQGIMPTLTFLLDLPPEAALERAKNPNYFEKQGVEFFTKVRNGFNQIAEVDKDRVVKIDATQSEMSVENQIIDTIKQRFRL
jgi:dTMP kinase